jgi:2-polyprenyl-3-methyl-5-hydroxy-6-metoxy-1,4-benzoquinol methylase
MDTRIGTQFARRAAHYDRGPTRWVGEREIRPIAALVPEGADVLDYGCGTGRATLAFIRRGCRVTAYDLSPHMLAVASRKVGRAGATDRVEFVDSEDAVRGRTFPVVVCIGVLDYYRDPVPLLATLAVYLAPGGFIISTFPNASSPLAWAYAVGSRFTFPAIPRTLASFRQAARNASLTVTRVVPVFPGIPALALTLAVVLRK